MAKVKKVQISEDKFQYHFICTGCNQEHAFNDNIWKWNYDYDNPTLNPSFLMEGYRYDDNNNKIPYRCHSYIINGKIQYLNDCTHNLKGKIVDLIDYDIYNKQE